MNIAKRYLVGLTGGIGSGKSSAAEIFRTCGIEVIDSDSLAKEVVELGQPALGDIAAHLLPKDTLIGPRCEKSRSRAPNKNPG
jgi:dephospho-CoA kinase